MVGVERAKNVDVLYMRGGKEMERITPFFLTEPMVDRARGFENTLPAEEGGSVDCLYHTGGFRKPFPLNGSRDWKSDLRSGWTLPLEYSLSKNELLPLLGSLFPHRIYSYILYDLLNSCVYSVTSLAKSLSIEVTDCRPRIWNNARHTAGTQEICLMKE